MLRETWARIKKSETVQFMRRHPIFTFLASVFAIGMPIIIGVGEVVSFIVISNIDTLKTLIGAEATVLGFFGFIAVYGLGSLDNRIDRLEQQIGDIKLEDLKKGGNKLENSSVCKDLCKKRQNIEEAKKRFGNFVIWSGAVLIASLITSIVAMGFVSLPANIPDEFNIAFTLSTISVLTFFCGIGLILSMISDSARKTEEAYDISRPTQ